MGRVALAFLFGACCLHSLPQLPDWRGALGLLVAVAALALVGRFKPVAGLLAGLAWVWLLPVTTWEAPLISTTFLAPARWAMNAWAARGILLSRLP